MLSILKNDTSYFDIIINDDCSTDNSVSIIEDFFKAHKEKTKLWQLNLNKVNLGINASIKNLLETNKNDWVKWLAGDDELESGSLLEYYRLASMNSSQSNIILSDMNLIDKDSVKIGKRKSLDSYFYENKWLKTANFYINTINAPTVMIGRKPALKALDETIAKNAEDWPVLRFCISRNFVFKICKKPLIKYRLHRDSLSSSYNFGNLLIKNKNSIVDQVEILLNENKFLSNSLSVQFGIYIQLKILKNDSLLKQFVLKALKLLNIQFCIYRFLMLVNGIRK